VRRPVRSGRAALVVLVIAWGACSASHDETVPWADRPFGGSDPMNALVPPASARLDALVVKITDAPRRATAGRTLHFTVVLSNPTSGTVGFGPCPVFEMSLGDSGTVTRRFGFLNCDEASSLKAGQAMRFDMRLPIPASGEFENSGAEMSLEWELLSLHGSGTSFDSEKVTIAA
jgi:hypothetical protein